MIGIVIMFVLRIIVFSFLDFLRIFLVVFFIDCSEVKLRMRGIMIVEVKGIVVVILYMVDWILLIF